MVDFICMGLDGQEREASKICKNEKFVPTVGFEPPTICLQSRHADHCAMDLI